MAFTETVTIVDYGMGNLASLRSAFARLDIETEITCNPKTVVKARRVILPGVGAFAQAMQNLRQSGMDQALRDFVRRGGPLLGICLGMQLLSVRGEEGGDTRGLALLNAISSRLPSGPKIPHVGWNRVRVRGEQPLFKGIPDGSCFYFVHSYIVQPENTAIQAATTNYGQQFCSAVSVQNLAGVQFHPEKSGMVGLQLLRNFAEKQQGE